MQPNNPIFGSGPPPSTQAPRPAGVPIDGITAPSPNYGPAPDPYAQQPIQSPAQPAPTLPASSADPYSQPYANQPPAQPYQQPLPADPYSQQPQPEQSQVYNQQPVGPIHQTQNNYQDPYQNQPQASYQTAEQHQAMSKLSRLKLPIIIFGAVVALGGASAGAYYGIIAKENPTKLWQEALVNTGKGYDKLAGYITNTKLSQGYSLKGSFSSTGSVALDGTLSGGSDSKNSQVTGTISVAGTKADFDLRQIASSNGSPDVYFKVNGVQGLGTLLGGSTPLAKSLNSLNNQWYFIDHSLFNKSSSTTNSQPQAGNSDISSALKAVGDASKAYIFTNDKSKSAIILKSTVGKETGGGRTAYHYKVSINKDNLKAFNKQLCNALSTTKLNIFLGSKTGSDSQCIGASYINGLDPSTTADAWVDTGTKLISKVRITQGNSADNYIDIAQQYYGGDNFPLTITLRSKDGAVINTDNIKLVFNTKTSSVALSGDIISTGGSPLLASYSVNLAPDTTPVNVTKPAGAKTLAYLLNGLGLGGLLGGVTTPTTPAKAPVKTP